LKSFFPQAIVLILRAINLLAFALLFFNQRWKSRLQQEQRIETPDRRGRGMPVAALVFLLGAGLLALVLGILLEWAVFTRNRQLVVEVQRRKQQSGMEPPTKKSAK
jgi:hypothetical protein